MIALPKDTQQSMQGHEAGLPVYVGKCNCCGQQLGETNTDVYLVNVHMKGQLGLL